MGVDAEGIADVLLRRLGAAGVLQPKETLDTRSLAEAWRQIDAVLLRMAGRFSTATQRNTRYAFMRILAAPSEPEPTVEGSTRCACLGSDDGATCLDGQRRVFARGARLDLRCTADDPRVLDGPLRQRVRVAVGSDAADAALVVWVRLPCWDVARAAMPEGDVTVVEDARERLGDVRICDLDRRHVTAAWNALAGPSLPAYGAAVVARLVEADDDLGFTGLKRWREMWPTIPQTRRYHVEVSDEIHREALRCLEWALDHRQTDEQTLRLLVVYMHAPGRLGEICSLQRHQIDFRSGVLRLEDSKNGPGQVVLTTRAIDLLRTQIATLPLEATWVWPGRGWCGHARPDSVSKAWLRIRRAYAVAMRTNEAAALVRWRAHDLGRGALTTQALEHGASARHVQRALRHADYRTTERYDHGRSMRGAREAMEIAVGPLRVADPRKRGDS